MSYISTMQNKPFNIYVITVEGRNWVHCMDNETNPVALDECKHILDNENSVILRYPYYPSAQVFVTNNTVDMQPAPATQGYLVESMLDVINQMYMSASTSPLIKINVGNKTLLNKTTANQTSGEAQ
jgi:hypothetical protein